MLLKKQNGLKKETKFHSRINNSHLGSSCPNRGSDRHNQKETIQTWETEKKKKTKKIYKILVYEDIPGQINQEKQSGSDEVDLIVVGMLGFFFSSIAAQMKKRTDAWDRESLIGARRLDSLFLFPLLRFPLFRFFIFFSQ